MPSTALKHLAKRTHTKPERAEHLWNKAKGIVSKEYGSRKKVDGYWALVMGITKKMMGLKEMQIDEVAPPKGEDGMNNLLRNLMMAQRCTHVHHWQTKSFAKHLALGELYEEITEFMDELAEMYMGLSGITVAPEQSDPNHFSQQDPIEFVRQFVEALDSLKGSLNSDPLINLYEEFQAKLLRIKYKLEQLN